MLAKQRKPRYVIEESKQPLFSGKNVAATARPAPGSMD